MHPNIKTIDVLAKEGKKEGQWYFSVRVVVNFGMTDEYTVYLPVRLTYKKKDYIFAAATALGITDKNLWTYCKDNGIILRTFKFTRCPMNELYMWADKNY